MKWSLKEDMIVCDFYLSHTDTWSANIPDLMAKLAQAGFVTREQGSVKMRIQNYEYLHIGKGLSHVGNQTKRVYNSLILKTTKTELHLEVQHYIEHNFIRSSIENDLLTAEPINTTSFVPLEPVGPSFQDTLFNLIDKRGMKDSEVYNACFVGRDTFSHIRKGDRGVSKKTIKQLCFGLKLSYEEAVILMESAGYAFSNSSIADLVVAYFLKNKIYDIFAANAELYERNEELLFAA